MANFVALNCPSKLKIILHASFLCGLQFLGDKFCNILKGLQTEYFQLRQCYLTSGQYPESLLQLWDQFDEERGSENDRPGL